MFVTPEALSWSDEPFRYVAGDPSLDLVNTVDWTDRGPEHDRLTDYQRLVSWAEGAGVLLSGGALRVSAMSLVVPLLILLLPTLFASFYVSYRDVFGVERP
jgi:hypothetical protein